MRIVIATPFYPPQLGVLATYAAGLEQAFKKAGHEAIVVPFSRGLPPGLQHLVYFLRVFLALRGAGFVLALDTWSVGMPAFFAARLRGTPFAVRIGGDFLWESYIGRTKEPIRLSDFYTKERDFTLKERLIFQGTRTILHGARALFFNTRFQIGLWQPIYGFDGTKAHVLENFYPTHEVSEPSHGRVFVSAGRHIALKNYAELERAFARVKEKHPDIDLDERLLPPPEHLARIRKSHAIIIPSLSEVSSNTAIDAVAAGKPFIMTDDTGTKERLAACGLFVDTRSEAALAQAIESVLESETYERLAAATRAFSFTHSWDDIAREVLKAMK